MRSRTRTALAIAAVIAALGGPQAFAGSATMTLPTPPVGVDAQCFTPTGRIDPKPDANGTPTNPDWLLRDQVNQYCATLRVRDQAASPAFLYGNSSKGNALYLAQLQEEIADGPGHVHGGLTTQIPGALAADPYRTVDDWQQRTGGRVLPVSFPASDGATLRGHIWLPPKGARRPAGGYPGVVITDGSIQAYENLYYWAAEGLAQYGYEVMTYDVQGQGHSDLLPASCTSPSSCPGVPYQQNYNFYQGAEDSLSFFLSGKNPGRPQLDPDQVGIAGHSLGASAVSWVGQCDTRVKTIVAWDDLDAVAVKDCAKNVTVPKAYRATRLHTPALATTNDYEFNVQPMTTVPDPHGGSNTGGLSGDSGYQSLAKAGVDAQLVSFRNGTHLTYTYIDFVMYSNELSERFAFHYTLAWFDQYLRGGQDPYTARPALQRLTDLKAYDDSADVNSLGPVSIGAGTYDPTAADPTDPMSGNTPYRIKGVSVPGSLSFYFYSQYRLTDPATRRPLTCTDMVAGCPATAPPTP
ncbi:MAG: hypothetical protein JWP11_2812 [Frankiales bacterium]|nr:hypothetical protein [Frankiales bacterium]